MNNKTKNGYSDEDINKLEKLVYHDKLTDLLNFRFYSQKITELANIALRYKRTFSIAVIDIDDFKQYNDTFGHNEGNIALKKIAKLLKKSIRKSDHAIRYGGEEFVILFQETDKFNANIVMERIRKSIENLSLKRKTTVSIGIAEFLLDTEEVDVLFKLADSALYKAKLEGKNRSKVYEKDEKYIFKLIRYIRRYTIYSYKKYKKMYIMLIVLFSLIAVITHVSLVLRRKQQKVQNLYINEIEKEKSQWQLIDEINFKSGKDLQKFKILNGTWKIENGYLIGSGSAEDIIILYNQPVEGDVLVEYTGSTSKQDLSCFIKGTKDRHLWDGYFIGIGTNENTQSYILRKGAMIFSNNFKLVPDKLYNVAIRKNQDNISVNLNGKKIINYIDFLPIESDLNKYIGFYTWDSKIKIKELRIFRKLVPLKISSIILGDNFFNKKDYKTALKIYNDIKVSNKNDMKNIIELDFKIGLCYFHLNNQKKAMEIFENLIEVKSNNKYILYSIFQLLDIYIHKDQYEKISKLIKELKTHYSSEKYYVLLQTFVFNSNEYLKQKLLFKQLVNFNNLILNNFSLKENILPELYNRLGEAYLHLSNFDSSVIFYKKTINNESYPIILRAWAQLGTGIAYYMNDNEKKALKTFNNLHIEFPEQMSQCAWASIKIGDLYLESGKINISIKHYKNVVDNYAKYTEQYLKALFKCGYNYLLLNNPEKSNECFKVLLSKSNNQSKQDVLLTNLFLNQYKNDNIFISKFTKIAKKWELNDMYYWLSEYYRLNNKKNKTEKYLQLSKQYTSGKDWPYQLLKD